MENHETARPLPPVRLVVAQGQEDVTLKISDEGGGISRSGIRRIWTYQYTTAERATPHSALAYQSDFHAPLAGLGYGLPISRLYARYFGGDLQVISMDGTDAYLHLKRLGDTKEVLPNLENSSRLCGVRRILKRTMFYVLTCRLSAL